MLWYDQNFIQTVISELGDQLFSIIFYHMIWTGLSSTCNKMDVEGLKTRKKPQNVPNRTYICLKPDIV